MCAPSCHLHSQHVPQHHSVVCTDSLCLSITVSSAQIAYASASQCCLHAKSGKKFLERLKQHESNVRGSNEKARKSSMCKHREATNHAIYFANAAVVFPCKQYKSRLIIEKALIQHQQSSNAEDDNPQSRRIQRVN